MVVLGGLEIAAVGYLLNEFNKEKIEERERRKASNHRPEYEHHDRPHDDRPHSRPHSNSRPPPPQPYPPQGSSPNLLALPSGPVRPLSAPPQDPRPEWQRQQGYQQQGQQMGPQFQHQQPMSMPPNGPQRPPQGPQQGPPGNEYPFQSQLWQKQQAQQAQQAQQHRPSQPSNFGPGPSRPPNQPPNQNPVWQPGPQPGPQGPGQYGHLPMNRPPQQYNNPMNGPPPPGPGHLQQAQTFHQGQQNQPNQPYIQSSNTFPQPQQQFQQGPPPPQQPFLQHQNTFPNQGPPQNFRPQTAPASIHQQPPTGPLVYINTKTGKVSHNLYPSDHPMHRPSMSSSNNAGNNNLSLARSNTDIHDSQPISKEFWGDEKYMRTMAGDVHTGMLWSEKDEDDLAYGKDYSFDREMRKREKQRGRKESLGREWSYERVRTDRDRERGQQWV